jgi:hypothetical protein
MPEAKILLATDSFDDYSHYYSSQLAGSITDWEEVTEEELDWLRSHLRQLPSPRCGLHYVLVVKDSETLQYRIQSIRLLIKEEKEKQEKERARREEINQRRQETKRKNKEEKERKLLEQLKGKYENG